MSVSIPAIPEKYIRTAKKAGLDLTYILPNVAACSAPTDKLVKKVYSNSLTALSQTLRQLHGAGNWEIMNLRTEKMGYDPKIIEAYGGAFDYRPFVDNNALPFQETLETVKAMDRYLSENKKKVVVVHCRHGKGRTGSVIVAYIMYKYGLTFKDANHLFTKRRAIFKHGVSVPSQVRYMGYLERYLGSQRVQREYKAFVESRHKVTLKQLAVHNLKWDPNLAQFDIRCHVYTDKGAKMGKLMQFYNRTAHIEWDSEDLVLTPRKEHSTYEQDLSCQFVMSAKGVQICMVWFWVNVALETREGDSSLHLVIPWEKMDGYRGSEKRGYKVFDSVELELKL